MPRARGPLPLVQRLTRRVATFWHWNQFSTHVSEYVVRVELLEV